MSSWQVEQGETTPNSPCNVHLNPMPKELCVRVHNEHGAVIYQAMHKVKDDRKHAPPYVDLTGIVPTHTPGRFTIWHEDPPGSGKLHLAGEVQVMATPPKWMDMRLPAIEGKTIHAAAAGTIPDNTNETFGITLYFTDGTEITFEAIEQWGQGVIRIGEHKRSGR